MAVAGTVAGAGLAMGANSPEAFLCINPIGSQGNPLLLLGAGGITRPKEILRCRVRLLAERWIPSVPDSSTAVSGAGQL